MSFSKILLVLTFTLAQYDSNSELLNNELPNYRINSTITKLLRTNNYENFLVFFSAQNVKLNYIELRDIS